MAKEEFKLLTLEGAERILDVGCGDGKITAEIAARVPRGSALGVDPSRDMIAFASSRFGSTTLANLRFAAADVRRLPYRDEFDLVVSFNALQPSGGEHLQVLPDGNRAHARVADGRALILMVRRFGPSLHCRLLLPGDKH